MSSLATVPSGAPCSPTVRAMLEAPERIGVRLQPVADLRAATVRGYSAVARVPGGSGRSPRAWFDEAAGAGHAGELEAQVVIAALVARPLLARGRFLAVALSDAALVSAPVRAAFAAEPALDHVIVELDGRASAVPAGEVLDAVAALRAAGARVAVDLGQSGVDGLDRVAALTPEYVRVAGDASSLPAIYAGLSALALEHDPWLIAGDVDDDAQLEAVAARGVRFAQGEALGAALAVPAELPTPVRTRLLARGPIDLGSLAEPGLAVGSSALALAAATPIREAARSAMARPPAVRFDPIAVIDDAGNLAGIVPIERLVSALAA